MADFRAKRTKVSADYLALLDPYSDKTLGDRCFYGAGQRFLTPIKLPGIDEDYEYFFPSGPHSYLSQEHQDTDFFRYPHKPRSQDLITMIENFWPNEATRKKRKNDLAPLARYKKRILEIDFAVFACKFVLNDVVGVVENPSIAKNDHFLLFQLCQIGSHLSHQERFCIWIPKPSFRWAFGKVAPAK
jgi:hypothetical protein